MIDLGAWASTAIGILAVLVLVVAIYVVVLNVARASIHIDAVKSAGDDAKDVAGLAELMQSELAALKEEGGGPSLRLVSASDAAIDIGSIDVGGINLKQLGALIKLLPGRTRVVTGQLQSTGAYGQGLTLTIGTSTNRIAATTTLWERSFVTARDLPPDVIVDDQDKTLAAAEVRECLALAGAAWIAFQALRNAPASQRAGLLTQDWESYAMFRVGARLQSRDLKTAARRLYLDALTRDPRNRGALFNLAILDFQEGNERSAIERLSDVIEEIERAGDVQARHLDRLWYRGMYNRAAARWNAAARAGGMPTARDVRDVMRDLEGLIIAANDTIDAIGSDAIQTGRPYADLVRFLIDVRSAALVMYRDAAGLLPRAA